MTADPASALSAEPLTAEQFDRAALRVLAEDARTDLPWVASNYYNGPQVYVGDPSDGKPWNWKPLAKVMGMSEPERIARAEFIAAANPSAVIEWLATIDQQQTRIAVLERDRDRLADFKTYVHERLDEAGVPVSPGGPHSDAGCRIGDRLDIVLGGPAPEPLNMSELLHEASDTHSREHCRFCIVLAEPAPESIQIGSDIKGDYTYGPAPEPAEEETP